MASDPVAEDVKSPVRAPEGTPAGFGRRGEDRRQRRFPPLRRLLLGGRRRAVRRREDQRRIVLLDRYSPKLFAAIVGILFLSVMDALLTLYLIEHGSSELNPVMGYFLQHGPLTFTVVKYLLTSVAVLVFLAVLNTAPPRWLMSARYLFSFTLAAFGLVVIWEILLICLIWS